MDELAVTLERSQGANHAELVKQGLVSPDFQEQRPEQAKS
jgi:hypothetical protein